MPLVIPTARSTYADSTTIAGSGHLSSYILAQLPNDANLSWVSEVRALCTVDELKWKVFQERRERLQAKNHIWKRILGSMRSATIVVIKPSDVEAAIREEWTTQGAENGVDFNQRMLIDACTTALIRDTPVAYLPNRLAEAMNLYPGSLFLEFDRFAPEQIKQRIGGKLRDAKVFAARAHATFDVVEQNTTTRSPFMRLSSPAASLVFRELLSTQRGFDEEHLPSVNVLNEAAEVMATALSEALMLPGELSSQPLVREFSSRDIDAIQAADIAAGWAHEVVALGNERALGATFGKVLVNGRLMD